jgi:vacuolar-type H+-ATPase subunit E/Vma4
MGQTQKELEAEADRILARAGYEADGREKSAKRESLRAISTPFGGKPGFKLK